MRKMLMFIVAMCAGLIMATGNAYAQTATATVEDVNASISKEDNSVNNVYDRNFVNPGMTPMPQTNGFFTGSTPDSSFRSVRELIKLSLNEGNQIGPGHYLIRMTEGALIEMARGGNVDSHLQIIRQGDRIYTEDFEDDLDNPKWLWIGIEEPILSDGKVVGTKRIEGLRVTGFVDGEADNGDTNSFQVLAKAGLKALKDGNNFMIVTKEGAHRMVAAEGWGVGLYTTGGSVTQDGMGSVVGGGGTGYAWNEVGSEDKPWFQGYVGCMPMEFLEDQIEAFEKSKK